MGVALPGEAAPLLLGGVVLRPLRIWVEAVVAPLAVVISGGGEVGGACGRKVLVAVAKGRAA